MRLVVIIAFLLVNCLPSGGEESGIGFDRREDPIGPSKKPAVEEMDQLLRPHVFARYDKFSSLEEAGEGLYRAQYRLPGSVYAPDRHGILPGVQQWLEEERVEFGPGSSVSFDERLRILDVVQTFEQLTRVELFLARFGGQYVVRVGMEVIELPLLAGWELVESATGMIDHTVIRDEAHNLEGRVVESFSSLLDLGQRSKLQRSDESDKVREDTGPGPVSDSAVFEFEPYYTERFNELLVNLVYERAAGEFDARRVVTNVRVPNHGSIIASSWKSDDKLQVFFLSGEVTWIDAVERVRDISGE